MLKVGRFYRLDKGKYFFIGRDEEGNNKIDQYKELGSLHVTGCQIAGPHILGYGELTEEEKQFAVDLFSRYSKVKGKTEIEVRVNGNIVKVLPVDIEKVEEKIKEFQIVG